MFILIKHSDIFFSLREPLREFLFAWCVNVLNFKEKKNLWDICVPF